MQTIKLTLEYDGTGYVGWQSQPNGPTIQEELEKALQQILREKVSTVAAGRTDAGVHAKGQVVSFRTNGTLEPGKLVASLNALLPHQIVVLSAELVEDSFHARFSARARVYRYSLALRPVALQRDFCWYVGGFKLDPILLDKCAEILRGEHDFTSFCKSNSDVNDFSCLVEHAGWSRNGSILVFEIRANRFLYGMVRALVGTMVEIARGHRPLEDFRRILDAKDRTSAGMSAPAKGLCLENIIYEGG
jgi:tRNA pseudouridine38-40 synthase